MRLAVVVVVGIGIRSTTPTANGDDGERIDLLASD